MGSTDTDNHPLVLPEGIKPIAECRVITDIVKLALWAVTHEIPDDNSEQLSSTLYKLSIKYGRQILEVA